MTDQFTITRKAKRQVKRQLKKDEHTSRNSALRVFTNHIGTSVQEKLVVRRWKNALQ